VRNPSIIKANQNDIKKISRLIQESIENVGDPQYSKEQIEAWKTRYSEEKVEKKIGQELMFKLEEEGELIATISLHESKVSALYIRHNQKGKGIGTQMLKFIEQKAKEEKMKKLELSSTPIAVHFYEKNGYRKIRDNKFQIANTYLPQVIMGKEITGCKDAGLPLDLLGLETRWRLSLVGGLLDS